MNSSRGVIFPGSYRDGTMPLETALKFCNAAKNR